MSAHKSAFVAAGVGAFFSILRFAIDLIVDLSDRVSKSPEVTDAKTTGLTKTPNTTEKTSKRQDDLDEKQIGSSVRSSIFKFRSTELSDNRFSVSRFLRRSSKKNDIEANYVSSSEGIQKSDEDESPQLKEARNEALKKQELAQRISIVSAMLHTLLFVYFLVTTILASTSSYNAFRHALYDGIPLGAVTILLFFGIISLIRDWNRMRFSTVQRSSYVVSATVVSLSCIILLGIKPNGQAPTDIDLITLTCLIVYAVWVYFECWKCPYPSALRLPVAETASQKKSHLTKRALLIILKPYFWPDATSNSARVNRCLAIVTWLCVGSSKACGLIAPIMLGKASTALTRLQYTECAKYAIYFNVLQYGSNLLKEGQSLLYLSVAKAAFIQLSELSFHHLHALSLDWHLRKKLGEVIRSMDRGIQACDTLMRYLFLFMLPAIAECLLVCIIFATYFNYLPIALAIFLFVFGYIVWTFLITVWRKKFRYSVAKSDNDWHDKATDSLVNFEVVKYFTAEKFEMEKFRTAITKYQSGNVNIQASLSFLNTSQNLLMQTCLAVALVLAAYGVKRRNECCISHGCEDVNSQCCLDLYDDCVGMEIGDFIAVLSYTTNLFIPLNFLGSVYNAVVMALIDLRNLSELLAESPDVSDAPDAIELPMINQSDPDIAVEFKDVRFHYPTQPESKGLKGVSFKLKRGTTTGIVGSTGAGKTTISRLIFRFYDVLEGSVMINGIDVRNVTQNSLRKAIGVVPQATSLFNDTVKENVLYGCREATESDLERVAKASQLHDFLQSLPEKWETVVGDRGLKLSGGEKQRVAIARCLLKDPPIVVLDEATSALDTITENSVQEALDALGSQRTCLVIAHRLGTIRNADNIIVMGDGCVLEQGTHESLLSLNGKYAEMWNMQLHSTRSSMNDLTAFAL